ncbi:MAG: molybdopterin cofactor-binding domain-containing protein [Arhodomonas sp.]|nr:molybdopterin cofactor-binding domain-containing protein [Arhodomonas sp.]
MKYRLDRDDDIAMTGKRHDLRIDYEVGFDDDGRIRGITFLQAVRCGYAAGPFRLSGRPGHVPCR